MDSCLAQVLGPRIWLGKLAVLKTSSSSDSSCFKSCCWPQQRVKEIGKVSQTEYLHDLGHGKHDLHSLSLGKNIHVGSTRNCIPVMSLEGEGHRDVW